MGLDTSSDTGLFMAFVDSQKQFRISALFFKSVAYASILVKKKKKKDKTKWKCAIRQQSARWGLSLDVLLRKEQMMINSTSN